MACAAQPVNDLGEPCSREPHARFDVAEGGTPDQSAQPWVPGRLPPTLASGGFDQRTAQATMRRRTQPSTTPGGRAREWINTSALPSGDDENERHGATITVILDHSQPVMGRDCTSTPQDVTWEAAWIARQPHLPPQR